MDALQDRFLRYVKIDTQSAEDSAVHPSTPGQMELSLAGKGTAELDLTNIRLSDKGYVMAELPANTDKDLPVVGFIAHLDTSPDVSGKDVFPLLFHDYEGSDLILNEAENLVIKALDYPELE